MGLLSELLEASLQGKVQEVIDKTKERKPEPGEYGNRFDINPPEEPVAIIGVSRVGECRIG